MKLSDNLAALLYLKAKFYKWRNISAVLAIFCLLLVLVITSKGVDNKSSDGLVEGKDYIAKIKINGVIFEDSYRSKVLANITKQKSAKAVIVTINSPGGGIVGSEILYNELREIANKKPLVVLMNSVAASGGYMAAVASDYIIAHNGTLTGSIGVLMQAPQLTELAKKVGFKMNTFKSSPLKGSPSPFEEPSIGANQAIQGSILDSYEFFSNLVKTRRSGKLNKDLQGKIFDGRVFTGRQALKAGLVDKIGSEKDVISYLGTKKVNTKLPIKVVNIVKPKDKFDKFFGILPFFNEKSISSSNQQIMAVMEGAIIY